MAGSSRDSLESKKQKLREQVDAIITKASLEDAALTELQVFINKYGPDKKRNLEADEQVPAQDEEDSNKRSRLNSSAKDPDEKGIDEVKERETKNISEHISLSPDVIPIKIEPVEKVKKEFESLLKQYTEPDPHKKRGQDAYTSAVDFEILCDPVNSPICEHCQGSRINIVMRVRLGYEDRIRKNEDPGILSCMECRKPFDVVTIKPDKTAYNMIEQYRAEIHEKLKRKAEELMLYDINDGLARIEKADEEYKQKEKEGKEEYEKLVLEINNLRKRKAAAIVAQQPDAVPLASAVEIYPDGIVIPPDFPLAPAAFFPPPPPPPPRAIAPAAPAKKVKKEFNLKQQLGFKISAATNTIFKQGEYKKLIDKYTDVANDPLCVKLVDKARVLITALQKLGWGNYVFPEQKADYEKAVDEIENQVLSIVEAMKDSGADFRNSGIQMLAEHFFRRKKYQAALDLMPICESICNKSKRYGLHTLRGNIYFAISSLEEAIKSYKAALDSIPKTLSPSLPSPKIELTTLYNKVANMLNRPLLPLSPVQYHGSSSFYSSSLATLAASSRVPGAEDGDSAAPAPRSPESVARQHEELKEASRAPEGGGGAAAPPPAPRRPPEPVARQHIDDDENDPDLAVAIMNSLPSQSQAGSGAGGPSRSRRA